MIKMTKSEKEKSKRIVLFFINNTDNLKKLNRSDSRELLKMVSFTLAYCNDVELKSECLELLYKCCFNMKLEIEELWNIYCILSFELFANSNIHINGNLFELYRFVYTKILGKITDVYQPIDRPNTNLIILVTNQFLGAKHHAPTRRILDYAYTLAVKLNKLVMIFNSAGYHFYPCACIEQYRLYNFVEKLNDISEVKYRGITIPFLQLRSYMPNVYCLNEAMQKIYQLQPELIYGVGDSNLLVDLCSSFTKTACIQCGTDIPISMSKYLLVGRKINEDDKGHLERLQPDQKVIETLINYELTEDEDSIHYKRSAFELKEDDFVIGVVGNRLDYEISKDFILIMERLTILSSVHFLLIGEIKDIERIQNGISNKNKLHFAGALPNASSAMTLFDVYCNPYRRGGGRSGFEALAHGIPVITLKYGDVYYTCGDEFAVDNWENYEQRVRELFYAKEDLSKLKQKAYERADQLSDTAKTQKEILDKIL